MEQASFRILHAEASLVQRRLIAQLLESKGHSVQSVNSLQEIRNALETSSFDLILLDLHLEGTYDSKYTESVQQEGVKIPIVALSSNPEDSESCPIADGFLAKPIRASSLYETLESILKPASSRAVLDEEPLMDRVGGNRNILNRMIEIFLQENPGQMEKIEDAVRDQEADALSKAAHAVKGSVANFEAHEAVVAARVLEMMGKSEDLVDAKDALKHLNAEMNRAREALQNLASQSQTSQSPT